MSGYDNPSFVTDDSSVAAKKSRKSSLNNQNANGGESLPTTGPSFVASYYPQSRPSISDDKSVCTLNIKPIDDGLCNTKMPEPNRPPPNLPTSSPTSGGAGEAPDREQWGKGVEFLMSCIAMSVGLGNVWRFPFVALQNGGGAFLIPYLIVLLLVGRPIYYLEMCIGQFSSRGSVKVYDFAPAMRGKWWLIILPTKTNVISSVTSKLLDPRTILPTPSQLPLAKL